MRTSSVGRSVGKVFDQRVQLRFIHSHSSEDSFKRRRAYSNRKTNSQFNNGFLKVVSGVVLGLGIGILFYERSRPLQSFVLTIEKTQQLSEVLEHDKAVISGSLREKNFLFLESANRFQGVVPDVDLFSLGGYRESLDRVADIVRYLQDPEEFIKSGAKVPSGVIISGPPGVGKTELAKAVAGHAGVPLFLVSGPELGGKFVGQTEENLRALFNAAEAMAPCVICIDEIDSLAAKRIPVDQISAERQNNANYHNSEVNQLLTLISQRNPKVVVIGTTNHVNSLDPAVVRPGRLERHLRISLPDTLDRKHILEIHTKTKKLASDVSLDDLASLSAGFSGAKLANWVNEAAVCALREKSAQIHLRHFDSARMLIQIGVAQKASSNPLIKSRTAGHEAGHAVVGRLLNKTLYKVTIRQHGAALGHTEWILPNDMPNPTKQDLLDEICMVLAGRAAEEISGIPAVGCESDFEGAKELATMMVQKEAMGSTIMGTVNEVEKILEEQMLRAITLLVENGAAWERVRDALIVHEELFASDVDKLIRDENIALKEKKWFWQKDTPASAVASEVVLPLPPKAVRVPSVTASAQMGSITSNGLPFTIDEVAKALGVNASSIRRITVSDEKYNSCIITFKPSFDRHDHMNNISQALQANDVENSYYSYDINEIHISIYRAGMEDFIKFVKNKNA